MVHDHTIAMRYKLIDSNNNAISLIKILLLLGLVVRFTLGKKSLWDFSRPFQEKASIQDEVFVLRFAAVPGDDGRTLRCSSRGYGRQRRW